MSGIDFPEFKVGSAEEFQALHLKALEAMSGTPCIVCKAPSVIATAFQVAPEQNQLFGKQEKEGLRIIYYGLCFNDFEKIKNNELKPERIEWLILKRGRLGK